MEQKKLEKLSLQKETIAQLSNFEQNSVYAGRKSGENDCDGGETGYDICSGYIICLNYTMEMTGCLTKHNCLTYDVGWCW